MNLVRFQYIASDGSTHFGSVSNEPGFKLTIKNDELNCIFECLLVDFDALADADNNMIHALAAKMKEVVARIEDKAIGSRAVNSQMSLKQLCDSILYFKGLLNTKNVAVSLIENLHIRQLDNGESCVISRLGYTDVIMSTDGFEVLHFAKGKAHNFLTKSALLAVLDVAKTWWGTKPKEQTVTDTKAVKSGTS